MRPRRPTLLVHEQPFLAPENGWLKILSRCLLGVNGLFSGGNSLLVSGRVYVLVKKAPGQHISSPKAYGGRLCLALGRIQWRSRRAQGGHESPEGFTLHWHLEDLDTWLVTMVIGFVP